MLKLEKMEEINILIHDKDLHKVTQEIVNLGIIHLVKVDDIHNWDIGLKSIEVKETRSIYQNIIKRIKQVSEKLALDLNLKKNTAETGSFKREEFTRHLEEIENKTAKLSAQKEICFEEIEKIKSIKEQAKIFSPLGHYDIKQKYSFLDLAFGSIEKSNLDILKSKLKAVLNILMPLNIIDNKIVFLVIVLKKDKLFLDQILKDLSFNPIEASPGLSFKENISAEIENKIKNKQQEIEKINQAFKELKETSRDFLLNNYKYLKFESLMFSAYNFYKKTQFTNLISGWIPVEHSLKLKQKIKEITHNRYIIEEVNPNDLDRVKAGELKVPVKFKNPKILSPFELLVTNYGIPAYNTLDPTIFTAITFLLIFGFMFGDIGHGFVLCLLGWLSSSKYSSKEKFQRIGKLVSYCGISSIVFGLLYGNIFGLENLIPALWLHPFLDIPKLFTAAIIVGAIIISLGIIINIVNNLKNKRYFEGIFDRLGILGGIVYWSSLGLVIKSAFNKFPQVPYGIFAVTLVTACLLLFFKKQVISIFKKTCPEKTISGSLTSVFENFIENSVELLELFIGYLTNTISFVRVAAFALSHAGLCMAVFSLSETIKEVAFGKIFSPVIIILGNIFIIGFEGIIIAIQSLRLEYYEFFNKFFVSGGKEFKPLKIE